MITSEKIKNSKKIVLLWLIVIVAFVVTFVSTFSQYSKYKEAQDYAASIIVQTQDKFRNKTIEPETVRAMYRHLQYWYQGIGYVYRDVDKSIAKMLTEEGYDCYYASEYLKYTSYAEYTTANCIEGYIVSAALFCIVLLLSVLYISSGKKTMVIEEDHITAYKGKRPVKQFLIKDIMSIDNKSLKGLKIRGNGFTYKINHVKNREEICSVILVKLQSASAPAPTAALEEVHTTDEIKKYKELLDSGIITQEEFDAKKKQLLGL